MLFKLRSASKKQAKTSSCWMSKDAGLTCLQNGLHARKVEQHEESAWAEAKATVSVHNRCHLHMEDGICGQAVHWGIREKGLNKCRCNHRPNRELQGRDWSGWIRWADPPYGHAWRTGWVSNNKIRRRESFATELTSYHAMGQLIPTILRQRGYLVWRNACSFAQATANKHVAATQTCAVSSMRLCAASRLCCCRTLTRCTASADQAAPQSNKISESTRAMSWTPETWDGHL